MHVFAAALFRGRGQSGEDKREGEARGRGNVSGYRSREVGVWGWGKPSYTGGSAAGGTLGIVPLGNRFLPGGSRLFPLPRNMLDSFLGIGCQGCLSFLWEARNTRWGKVESRGLNGFL